MIRTISDLLKTIRESALKKLSDSNHNNIKHAPTIGQIYEGLTKEILEKTVFEGLDLRIRSGFVRKRNRELSKQIDCMLVIGEGDQIPHTKNYIYDINKVVAVIEVKKNLFSHEIESSFENLKSVLDYDNDIPEKYHEKIIQDSWRGLFQEETPSEFTNLGTEKEMRFWTLFYEALTPIRIVFGYDGFSSVHGLREGFKKFIHKNRSTPEERKKGYGPLNFPSLIINNEYSLIKLNGMPYTVPIQDNSWLFYASTNEKPFHYFLEVIWTRLSYIFRLPSSIFGEDLTIDNLQPFLACKFDENNRGWIYPEFKIKKAELEEKIPETEWQPQIIDDLQFRILDMASQTGYIDKNEIEEIIKESDYSFDEMVLSLKKLGFVNYSNDKMTLITEKLMLVKNLAADDKTGQFSRWKKNNSNKA